MRNNKFHIRNNIYNIYVLTFTTRLAEWVAILHAARMATVVMCRGRNPVCTAREQPRVVVLYIYGRSFKKYLHIQPGFIKYSKDRPIAIYNNNYNLYNKYNIHNNKYNIHNNKYNIHNNETKKMKPLWQHWMQRFSEAFCARGKTLSCRGTSLSF